MKRSLITLTVSEGKRLIAKGVAKLPSVQQALKEGTIIIAGGTTNGYIAEELTGARIDKERYTAGVICQGRICVTPPEERIKPLVLKKGQVIDSDWQTALHDFTHKDVFIKGGNALDPAGNVGVLMANREGGTIGKALPVVAARGSQLILPVGLEKLIPSVPLAAASLGIDALDEGMGLKAGLMIVSYGQVITEIEALLLLGGPEKVIPVAAGGIGGSEGSLTLLLQGKKEAVDLAYSIAASVKGEPPLPGNKRACPCRQPCLLNKLD